MTARIDRRETLRYGALGVAGLLGSSALAACAPTEDDGGRAPGASDPAGIQLVSSDARRAAGDPTVLSDVVGGLQLFAGELYGGVAAAPGNVVISPYSVLIALGMTLTGAGGTTAEEMASVLHAGGLGERWHKGVNALTAYVDGLAGKQKRDDGTKAGIALSTANQLFGQKGVAWEADFLDLLAKEYGAGLRGVDFAAATEQARLLVNQWVEQQTRHRIRDLVPQGVLDPATRLVLVNALFLEAPWEQPFDKELTGEGEFHLDGGGSVRVDMMHRPDLHGSLAEGEGWRAARVRYAGGRLAMTVVLPDEGRLRAVEELAGRDGFGAFLAAGRPAAVALTMPRWRFRTQAALAELLAALGMPTAFDEHAADFTPMTEDDLPLHVGAALHQGWVAVDEDGTEAAAATAVVMEVTGAAVTEEVVLDRPFLFVVHDVEHGTPLFAGRVSDPSVD